MADETPYRNFNFRVEIDGIDLAGFSEVRIPEGSVDVVEYREGTDRELTARKLPGRVHFTNVVLRRGIDGRGELWQWWNSVRHGTLVRRDVVIVLQDREQADVVRWVVRRAWPVRYAASPLRGRGRDIAVETVELACEGLELET